MRNIVFPKTHTVRVGSLKRGETFISNGKAFTKIDNIYVDGDLKNVFNQSDSRAEFIQGNTPVNPCPDAELLLEGRK